MKTVTDGACIFCGQILQVEIEANSPEEEVNEAATIRCGCGESILYRQKKEAVTKIDTKFREHYGPVADLLIVAIERIQKRNIKSITIDVGNGVKGSVAMTKEGMLKIKREDKSTSESTVC